MNNVRNNWFLLAGIALVSFVGALVYSLFGEQSIAVPIYFIIASISLAASAFAWYSKHPPALKAPKWAYAITVLGLEFGAFILGGIEDTRAVGAWIAVGLGIAVFGYLEKSGLIIAVGLCAAAASVIVYAANASNIGVTLEIITGVIFAIGAVALKRMNSDSA